MLAATAGGELVAGESGQSPVQLASYDVSSGTATVLAQEIFLYEASNLRSMHITPDGKDVVLASGAPYYQEIYQVSDLSADGTYATTNYPTSVAIAGDGTVAAGTCCGYQANGDTTNEIFMFAPGSSTPLNTIGFGNFPLQNDGAALTPDGSLLFAVTVDFSPMLNIIPDPEQSGPHSTSTTVECTPGPVAIGQAASCTATVTDNAPNGTTAPDWHGHLHVRHQRRKHLRQFLHPRPGQHQRPGVVLGRLHPRADRSRNDHRQLRRRRQPRRQQRPDHPRCHAARHRHGPDLPATAPGAGQVHGHSERHLAGHGRHARRDGQLYQQRPRRLQRHQLHPVGQRHVGVVRRVLRDAGGCPEEEPDHHRRLRR